MITVPLPSAVVPIAPAPDAHEVAADPVVAAVAPFMVPADPDEAGPIARMLIDRWWRRIARAVDRRRLAPFRVGHRG